jgi:hypothetical protein
MQLDYLTMGEVWAYTSRLTHYEGRFGPIQLELI